MSRLQRGVEKISRAREKRAEALAEHDKYNVLAKGFDDAITNHEIMGSELVKWLRELRESGHESGDADQLKRYLAEAQNHETLLAEELSEEALHKAFDVLYPGINLYERIKKSNLLKLSEEDVEKSRVGAFFSYDHEKAVAESLKQKFVANNGDFSQSFALNLADKMFTKGVYRLPENKRATALLESILDNNEEFYTTIDLCFSPGVDHSSSDAQPYSSSSASDSLALVVSERLSKNLSLYSKVACIALSETYTGSLPLSRSSALVAIKLVEKGVSSKTIGIDEAYERICNFTGNNPDVSEKEVEDAEKNDSTWSNYFRSFFSASSKNNSQAEESPETTEEGPQDPTEKNAETPFWIGGSLDWGIKLFFGSGTKEQKPEDAADGNIKDYAEQSEHAPEKVSDHYSTKSFDPEEFLTNLYSNVGTVVRNSYAILKYNCFAVSAQLNADMVACQIANVGTENTILYCKSFTYAAEIVESYCFREFKHDALSDEKTLDLLTDVNEVAVDESGGLTSVTADGVGTRPLIELAEETSNYQKEQILGSDSLLPLDDHHRGEPVSNVLAGASNDSPLLLDEVES